MTKQLANLRKAVAGIDDNTLTRWVKEPTRHTSERKTAPMPADASGTRFKTRVLGVHQMGQLLVSGHSNVKIGRDVRKGKLKGYWIYTLSLEERATCPSSCAHWTDCYGNSMPFAKRIDHRDPAFLPTLEAEIERLLNVRGRVGVLIRLHALGDFYSEAYVDFWAEMLRRHPRLAIYGYTAHPLGTAIGDNVHATYVAYRERFMVRHSDSGDMSMATVAVSAETLKLSDAFICPEQTNKTQCCATCALCWSTPKNVAFVGH